MTEIKDLYILCGGGTIRSSYEEIKLDGIAIPYSYLSITANSNYDDVQSLKGVYVYGLAPDEQIKFFENNANMKPIISIHGNTLLEALRMDYVTRDIDFLNSVLVPSIYPGEMSPSGTQKYINTLVGGLAMTFFTYKVMCKLKYYGPFKHDFPLQNLKLQDLSQNLYHYINHLMQFMNIIESNHISKYWFTEMEKTWQAWHDFFIVGPTYNNNVAISNVVHGYSKYIKEKSLTIGENYQQIETAMQNNIANIDTQSTKTLIKIDETKKTVKRQSEKLMIYLTTMSTLALAGLSKKHTNIIEELEHHKATFSRGLLDEYVEHKNKYVDETNSKIEDIQHMHAKLLDELRQEMIHDQNKLDAKFDDLYGRFENHYQSSIKELKDEKDRCIENLKYYKECVIDDLNDALEAHKKEIKMMTADLDQRIAARHTEINEMLIREILKSPETKAYLATIINERIDSL